MLHKDEDGLIRGELPNTDQDKQDYEDGFEDGSNRKVRRKPFDWSYMMGYQNGLNILATLEGFIDLDEYGTEEEEE
ncbi:MAG: hypothetical protein ACRCU2_00750 [Planktothrix sp.]